MVEPFRIHVGDQGPVQQTGYTCGSVSLIVARMLVDPHFAHWVVSGEAGIAIAGEHATAGSRSPGTSLALGSLASELTDATEAERVAAVETLVLARTNRLVGPGGRAQLPWPRRLGTPPWGALAELEEGAAVAGARYRIRQCRLGSERRLRLLHAEIVKRVGDGRPALLYIGNATLPRHVTLLTSSESGQGVDVFDPSNGSSEQLSADAFAMRRLRVAGWDVPWCVVWAHPDGATPA